MPPDAPERPTPLPGMLYSSLRTELGYADTATDNTAPDSDWGINDGFVHTHTTHALKDQAAFERRLRAAQSPDAPPVHRLREAFVKRCQSMHREYVRGRRKDPKRREIEDRLSAIAAQQIAVAERMLAELYDVE